LVLGPTVVPAAPLLGGLLERVAGLEEALVLELAALVAGGLQEAQVGQAEGLGPAGRPAGGAHALLGESEGQRQRSTLQLPLP
jgi:hypothetical protein